MDFPERILRTFNHKPIDKVVWQPRFAYWFDHYVAPATEKNYQDYTKFTPKEYLGMDSLEIYEDLGASIRYSAESLKIPLFFGKNKSDAEISSQSFTGEDGSRTTIIKTPVGEVSQTGKNGYVHDHMVKKVEDLKVMKYLVEQSYYEFNQYGFDLARDIMEPEFGIPTAYYFRSPYMKCVLEYLGFEKTIIFLRRHPKEMEDFLQFLDEWDQQQYENVICPSPLQWINFGENIDQNLSPPRYFEKYLLEYYHDRVKRLKRSGKLSFIHVDGSFQDLLPYLPDLPQDGIEALTPPPQGDVSIPELGKVMGDSGKILLDVLPATLFMEQFSVEKLEKATQEILDMFAPNLILGISDELCMGDGRRLKNVSKIVDKFEPH